MHPTSRLPGRGTSLAPSPACSSACPFLLLRVAFEILKVRSVQLLFLCCQAVAKPTTLAALCAASNFSVARLWQWPTSTPIVLGEFAIEKPTLLRLNAAACVPIVLLACVFSNIQGMLPAVSVYFWAAGTWQMPTSLAALCAACTSRTP